MTEAQPRQEPAEASPARAVARPDRRAELLPRILSALVMGVLAVATAWLGGAAFDLFWCLAAAAVLWEWHGLVGTTRRVTAAAVGGVALAAGAVLSSQGQVAGALAALVVGSIVTSAVAQPGRRGIAASGVLYAGALAVSLPLLRHSVSQGFAAVIWLFAVVWGTDTLAFFGGRTVGGPKLAPRLSPSKTWSGFVIGVGAGALLGLAVAPPSGCPVCVVVAGVMGGALAQAGDLFESSLKRRFGVKDAGSLIPGHGGVMDRLDGFMAASLFAAVVGLWRFGPAGAGAGLLKW